MEAVKPKTKAKKTVKAKPRDQVPPTQEQKPKVKPEVKPEIKPEIKPEVKSNEPKAKEKGATQEVEKLIEAQEITPQQPGRSPEKIEKNTNLRSSFGRDFDKLLEGKNIDKIYPKLNDDDENELNQEKNEETKQRMAQYAEATKEKLDMMAKFLEDIDEREAKEKEKEDEKEQDASKEEDGAENGDEESYFYHLVETFRQAQVERANSFPDYVAKSNTDDLGVILKVWEVKKFQRSQSTLCPNCGVLNSLSLDCSIAIFDKEACDEFVSALQDYRAMQSSATVQICRGSLAKYRIQQHIAMFIKSTTTFGALSPNAPVIAVPGCQQSPELVHDMAYMRHMLKVLFHFDRNKPDGFRELASLSEADLKAELRSRGKMDEILFMLMAEFYRAVEGWILEIGAFVLRLASFDDHMFVLQQLLACPGCSSWGGTKLVQFSMPETWNEAVFNHFKDVLLAVTRPERKRKQQPKSEGRDGKTKRGGKLEWKYDLVDEKKDGDDFDDLRAFEALETDIIALYEQIPIGPFCSFLLNNGQLYDTFMRNIFEMLKALCEAVKKLKDYNAVAKHIINTITIFLTVVAKRNEELTAASTAAAASLVAPPQSELTARAIEHQKQFNACFVSIAYSILTLGNSSLWQFLSALPFSALDEQGAWQTLGVLHFVDIAQLPQSHDDWNRLRAGKEKKEGEAEGSTPYESFVKVCENDFTNGTYLINGLGALGSSPRATEAIELICLDTLYEAGLIDKRTRANFLKTIVGSIAKILERHPDRISYLLNRIDDALSRNMHAEAAEYLFSHIPLDIWTPPLDIIWEMGRWAAPLPSSPPPQEQEDEKERESETARKLKKMGPGKKFFERINWGDPRMSVDANLCAALAILNIWSGSKDEYMTKSALDIAGKDKYNKTVEWCWSQLLRLRYARPGENRTLRPTVPTPNDTPRDREMRKPWSLAAAQVAGIVDGTIPPKSVEALPLFVGIALRTPDEVVESLIGRDSEGMDGKQEVVRLLSTLVDTNIASAAAGAALLLSQFVSLVIQASVTSENYLDVLTPEFVALVEKIIRSRSSSTWWKAGGWINPLYWVPTGDNSGTKDMAALLVMDQIEQERNNAYLVSKCAEFWTLGYNKGSAWLNDSAHTDVVETVLLSWFCFVNRSIPVPLIRDLVDRTAQSIAASTTTAAAKDNATGVEVPSLLPDDPFKRTLLGIVWSDDLAKILGKAPFLTFQILFTEATRRGEQAGYWSIKTFTQWFNYGMNLDTASEGNVLYWDVIVYAYFKLLFVGDNRSVLVRNFAPKMIKRLGELETTFLSLSSAERVVVRFFRHAAKAVKSSVDNEDMTRKSLIASLSQAPQQTEDGEIDGYDPLILQCVTQSPIAIPGRLLVQHIDVDHILATMPRFARARAPVHFDTDQWNYYDIQLARKTESNSVMPPPPPKYSWKNKKGDLFFTNREFNEKDPKYIKAKVEEGLNVISANAESEYNRINALLRLDREYVGLLKDYYTNTHSPNATAAETCFSCGRLVTAGIEQDKAKINEYVNTQMINNRKLAEEYSKIPARDKADRIWIVYLEELITKLGKASAEEVAAKAKTNTSVSSSDSGSVLALCKDVWTMLVMTYSLPHVSWWLEDVFIELIRDITTIIVRDSNKDAWGLLESVLTTKPKRIGLKLPAPQRTFCPWHNRTAFPTMLERTLNEYVAGSSKNASKLAGEVLRSCFRVDKWLAVHGASGALPLEERGAVINTLVSSIKTSLNSAPGKKVPLFVREHCAYVFRSVCDALSFAFPELIENAIEGLFYALSLKDVAPAASAQVAAESASFWAMLATKLPLERITFGKAQNLMDIIAARLSYLRTSCGTCGALTSAVLAPSIISFANALLEKAVYPVLDASLAKTGGSNLDLLGTVASLADSYIAMVTPMARYEGNVGDTETAKNAAQAVFIDGLAVVLGKRLGAFAPEVVAPRMWNVLTENTRVLTFEALGEGKEANGKAPIWFQDIALGAFCKEKAWCSWKPSFEQVDFLYGLLLAASGHTPMQCSAQLPRLLLTISLRVDWRAQKCFGSGAEYSEIAKAYGLVLHLAALSLRLAPAATLESDGTESALAEFHRRIRRVSINAVPLLGDIYKSICANALQRLRDVSDPEGQARWRLIFQLAAGLRVDADETTPERKFERLQAFAAFYAEAQSVSPEPHFEVFVPMVLEEHLALWKSVKFERMEAAERVVISLFGVYNGEGTRPDDFHKTVVEYLANGRVEEAPYFVNYACRSILSVQRMPVFVEGLLNVYFGKYGNWKKAASSVQVPDIGRHEFLGAAAETGSVLTLFAAATKMKESDPAEFASKLVPWTLGMKVVPGTEHRYLLFVNEVFKRVAAAPNVPSARETLEKVAERLAELGADKKYAGGLGGMIFGMGETSAYSARFRFAAKALSAFVWSQLLPEGEGGVRTSDLEPLGGKGDKAFRDMGYVVKDKGYLEDVGKEDMESVLVLLEQTVRNNNHTFVTSEASLMKKVVGVLYPDKKELADIIG